MSEELSMGGDERKINEVLSNTTTAWTDNDDDGSSVAGKRISSELENTHVVEEFYKTWGPATFCDSKDITLAVEMCRRIPDLIMQPSMTSSISAADQKWIGYMQKHGLNWEFDMMGFSKMCHGNALLYTGLFFFDHFGLIDHFKIPRHTLREWLISVQSRYHSRIAYHNSAHGADVCHATALILSNKDVLQYMDKESIFCSLFSALIHDIDHPGVSNAYLIKTNSDMAFLYNDTNVLEMHHLFVGFGITMDSEKTNILSSLSTEQYKTFRKAAVFQVLATDLANHFDHLNNFTARLDAGTLDPKQANDRLVVQMMALKCADMNHPTKSWDIHRKWSMSVLDEMKKQMDLEFKLGLIEQMPPMNEKDVPKSQVDFILLFILPLYQSMSRQCDLSEQMQMMDRNITKWRDMILIN